MSNENTVERVVIGVYATYKYGEGDSRVRTARRGDTIEVSEAEAARLDSLGTVVHADHLDASAVSQGDALTRYRAERGDKDAAAAVARAVAPTDPIANVAVEQASVSPPPLGAEPRGGLTTGDTGGPDTAPPAGVTPGGPVVRADAPDVAEASVGEISKWISDESPNAGDTVALAEGDPALAQKVLDAEREATGGDPRKTVEGPLEKIIDDSE